jgi:hypothetical protein
MQWAVLGQDFRKGCHRVELFRHGDHPIAMVSPVARAEGS